ncbi:hypothetical protein PHMEG_00011424 [Phytophthora megakarya]|uniref:Uncharacterized protein n=1 Tax=Phytophthora megakarya TaxID=4795 RepID=A0A225WB91_9STRA|nr:hypothetical protein PHMEG_00011424 [Phytophthora megakarya]
MRIEPLVLFPARRADNPLSHSLLQKQNMWPLVKPTWKVVDWSMCCWKFYPRKYMFNLTSVLTVSQP